MKALENALVSPDYAARNYVAAWANAQSDDVEVVREDLEFVEGEWTIDSMPVAEWLEAMTAE